ncbi:hypothetical protein FRB97_008812, partial [Tulasnella sp. 331]
MPYVLLTAAYNSLFILAYMALEISFSPPGNPKKTSTHNKHDSMDSIDYTYSTHATSSKIDRDLLGSLHNRKRSASLVAIDAGISQSGVSEEAQFGEAHLVRQPRPQPLQVPVLLEAINLNGMVLFLI